VLAVSGVFVEHVVGPFVIHPPATLTGRLRITSVRLSYAALFARTLALACV
jgi:hypothetical protein